MKFLSIFLVFLLGTQISRACPACGKFAPTPIPPGARISTYDLAIDEIKWSPDGGRAVRAYTINGTIPGPTLRFRVGEWARISVHNRLKNEETSVHWHGLLVPNQEDGVPHVTTPPIAPGTSHTFQFPLTHTGTYWYHSHTALQEQNGVYGSIVVLPKATGKPDAATRDHVIVLSDWTRENPHEVMRSLKRGSEWYEIKKGSAQSLSGAWKTGALREFFDRERSRMPAMDISDIAYDAFLANGKRTLDLAGSPGERVRLRFINAAASTYFHIESATGPLQIIAADGPDVVPFPRQRLFIGMAETYDVIVTVPPTGKWEIRATAQDGSGHASVFLGSGEIHRAPDVPKPDLYRMDSMMAGLEESGAVETMDHSDRKTRAAESPRPLSPYALLRSPRPTALRENLPRRSLTLRLTGDMERYIWSFNGKTFAEDGVIPVQKNEVLQLELINDTMMHHPLHLHGHFFRVLNGHGARSPLKHTIDIPPMSKRVIEFEANETGDWLFHCHLLYHMHAGMTRIISNQENPLHRPAGGEHSHDPFYLFAHSALLSNMTAGNVILRDARNDFFATWEAGFDDGDKSEAELGWSRYFTPNLTAEAGWRFTGNSEDGSENAAFAGISHRLPYLVWFSLQADSHGELRAEIEKELMLTQRLGIFAAMEYDTASHLEWKAGASYRLSKHFSLIGQHHSEFGTGAGLGFEF